MAYTNYILWGDDVPGAMGVHEAGAHQSCSLDDEFPALRKTVRGYLTPRLLLALGADYYADVFQPLDADLTAIAAQTGTGIAVRTAANAWALRTLQAPAAGLTITNPAGVAGDMTFALANDLAALEGLASTGIAVRTAANTWAQRSIAAGTGISVTNGDGVSGNPTVALSTPLTVPNGGTGVSTLTGLVKGNGTSPFSAAVAGTDYATPEGVDADIAAHVAESDPHPGYARESAIYTTTYNVILSEDGGQSLDGSDGVLGSFNVAVGAGAMLNSVTANTTVAIGFEAAKDLGQQGSYFSDFPTGFSGTNWAGGTHTPGSTVALSAAFAPNEGQPYYLDFTVTGRTAGSVTPKLTGGAVQTGVTRSSNATFRNLFSAGAGNTALAFEPSTDFDGTISAVEVTTLDGRAGVYVGHQAGAYVGVGYSNVFVGGFSGQGQERDNATGADISGTHALFGGQNVVIGEAAGLHMIGDATGNAIIGYNAGFNAREPTNLTLLGLAAGFTLTDAINTVAVGQSSYQYGMGDANTFMGMGAGRGNVLSTTLAASTVVGSFTVSVTDASIFTVGGMAINGACISPGALVTAVDTVSSPNTITLDKALWSALDINGASTSIVSVPAQHTSSENVGVGYLALNKISGAAQYNTAFGPRAGQALTTGVGNTHLGRRAGYTQTTGSGNILIGDSVLASAITASYEINIGDSIYATGINSTSKVGIEKQAPEFTLDVNGPVVEKPGTSISLLTNSTIGRALPANGRITDNARGSDGTTRTRTHQLAANGGQETIATDAGFTLVVGTNAIEVLHTGTLTANRNCALSTSGVFAGARFRVTRTGGGAFNLNVGTGPLKALATNTWCEVVHDGTNWYLAAYGAL